MQGILIKAVLNVLMTVLTKDLLLKFADMVLDFVEDYVLGTKSEIDDALVLPLCDMIRSSFDIPDND